MQCLISSILINELSTNNEVLNKFTVFSCYQAGSKFLNSSAKSKVSVLVLHETNDFWQVAEYVMILLRQLFGHNCSIF